MQSSKVDLPPPASQCERPYSGQESHHRAPSPRQLEVLVAIRKFALFFQYPPTIRELGDRLGIRSTNGVNDHLEALERKGLIHRSRMTARGLALTEAGLGYLGVL